ncbi:hypothetical protein MZD04_gp125 [Pseudomonas phage Psa21]|uniref:Uncharacterized protein n=1 Tax=Pseudomonas phage Psa21 TaxID=2530023 RepID=A0A481W5J7_9CAUD|nr:hypothetical protein MZD04_gp125 [Pseudomonas phage Psa21]QBJ02653.1 hypothetical protein PSA21_125 [Pseudomonas phage Psa21]
MRTFLLVTAGLVVSAVATSWNQSRLNRNDYMRDIPKEIESEMQNYTFKPSFEELKEDLSHFEHWARLCIMHDSHREEFIEELNKQIRMATR